MIRPSPSVAAMSDTVQDPASGSVSRPEIVNGPDRGKGAPVICWRFARSAPFAATERSSPARPVGLRRVPETEMSIAAARTANSTGQGAAGVSKPAIDPIRR